MARNEFLPETFDALAAELLEASNTLKSLSQSMKESGIPHALVHGILFQNVHVPTVLTWVGKTNVDVRTQIRAYLAGVPSQAEVQKKRNDTQKLAAAKKPWPKKATKKKTI